MSFLHAVSYHSTYLSSSVSYFLSLLKFLWIVLPSFLPSFIYSLLRHKIPINDLYLSMIRFSLIEAFESSALLLEHQATLYPVFRLVLQLCYDEGLFDLYFFSSHFLLFFFRFYDFLLSRFYDSLFFRVLSFSFLFFLLSIINNSLLPFL